MILEFVSPDRYHMTRESELPGRAAVKQETIIVGGEAWIKMGDAPWQRFPGNLGETIAQLRNTKVVEELSKAMDVKLIGPETLDGSPTTVYQYNIGEAGSSVTSKVWVGDTDHLPHKQESNADMNLGGRQVQTKTVVAYSDYGANIKIERPMP
jgi:hypothetical protein